MKEDCPEKMAILECNPSQGSISTRIWPRDIKMDSLKLKSAVTLLVPEIVLRLLEEKANTISKVKVNKIGFKVLV